MATMKIILGCDTSGFPLKSKVLKALEDDGYDVTDVGCYNTNDGYYLDAAEPVCKGVQSGKYDRGILFCGTGQGMNISANKFTGIRSAICYDIFAAKMSRADCNANVLCTGAWIVKPDDGIQMIKTWLMSDYYDTNVYGIERMAQFEKAMKN
jgi:ribose 5-phosphate isomerase B